ncbi:hypothetical protein [Paraburkholderia pallida]|uniref:Uncharacterized protein n=1 Tax=Paraburkholderia pallida TaxID=2547399 RepID=A0A4P7DAT7_9BURK|nr:hypothetical protein [Paraburkholderia pallida]QBR04265.1 hypothetical protein E1956_44910 [Paraburkholderia pallida]
MSLSNAEKKALLNASLTGVDAIDAQIEILRAAYPHAFHTLDSLATRRFFDQPKHELPSRGFVRAYETGQDG